MILTTLHEGGHGLYDQGFASADRNSLLARAPSMGLHEAQARFWENHIGRSVAFWKLILPELKSHLGSAVTDLDHTKLFQASNRVMATHIRANADELSYHLHIMLRYELETAMIAGDLKVADLPGAWNESSKALLGIAPGNDCEGVLQDGHWPSGMFGYFPTYTIGSLYAAQLAEACSRPQPLEKRIEEGDFASILEWQRQSIHIHGDRYTADELVEKATGTRLDPSAYFAHLQAKYG